MKAKIVYIALALVLVFSLAAVAIVPARSAMAEESNITIDLVQLSWPDGYQTGNYWTIYQEFESHASVGSDCGVSSGNVDMTVAIVLKFDPGVMSGTPPPEPTSLGDS